MIEQIHQILGCVSPEYWIEIAKMRGTDSLPSFTTNASDRPAGRTGTMIPTHDLGRLNRLMSIHRTVATDLK
jgi:hypothetical protein